MKYFIMILILLTAVIAQADSFTIDSVDCDMAGIYSFLPQNNIGAYPLALVGQAYTSRLKSLVLRPPSAFNDSMIAHDDVTWDSLIIILTAQYASKPITDNDSVCVVGYVLMQDAWVEGAGSITDGKDTCGVCWDSANSTGHTGCAGDATDWNTNGAEGVGTDREDNRLQWLVDGSYQDSIWFDSTYQAGDSIRIKVTGSDLTDTLNNAGILLKHIHVVDNESDNTMMFSFNSDDCGLAVWRPTFIAYYTAGGEAETTGRRRRLGGK